MLTDKVVQFLIYMLDISLQMSLLLNSKQDSSSSLKPTEDMVSGDNGDDDHDNDYDIKVNYNHLNKP